MSTNKTRFHALVVPFLFVIDTALAVNVNLNFFVGNTKVHTASVAAGGTYTIDDYDPMSMSAYECRDYSFVGWKIGSPVQGDESPAMPASVTPVANVNLYAVFEKASVSRYARITSTDNLEAGKNYLIVCYYVKNGVAQYYAMNNVAGYYDYTTYDPETHWYDYNHNYRLGAARVFAKNGVISEPDNSTLWQLGGAAGSWKWVPVSDPTKSLNIRDNEDNYPLLNTDDNRCRITVANGIFSFLNSSADDQILKYSDDENWDYFCTGSVNNYAFFLYKEESPYTSFLDCEQWTVNLDALEGNIGSGAGPHTQSMTEGTAGAGVVLPTVYLPAAACSDWSFAGWHVDSPVETTTTAPTLHSAGSYNPQLNDETLYSVFVWTSPNVEYELVTTTDSLKAGEKYLIVCYRVGANWQAFDALSNVYYDYDDDAHLASAEIDEDDAADGVITNPDANLIWTLSGSEGHWHWTNDELNKQLYFDGTQYSTSIYLTDGEGSEFTLTMYGNYLFEVKSNNRCLDAWNGTSHFGGFPNHSDVDFYLYKLRATEHTYSSYPHCRTYTTNLHACGGTIDVSGNPIDYEMTEESAGAGITLPSATGDCGWTFAGWAENSAVRSVQDTASANLLPAGTVYYPQLENINLYAVYKKEMDKFLIVEGAENIVSGDTYLITINSEDGSGSGKKYDWMLSSRSATSTTLKGIKGKSPKTGTGYYLLTSDSTVMWKLVKSGSMWFIEPLLNTAIGLDVDYSYVKVSGHYKQNIQTAYNDLWGVTIGYGEDDDAMEFDVAKQAFKYAARTCEDDVCGPSCYIYRRMKELNSWPHCEPMTAHFDACGGTADVAELTEETEGDGIILPSAYASADCSSDGWSFAGWLNHPVSEETDLMTFDLFSAGELYYPTGLHDTLYAVYQRKSNKFKSITTDERIHTGVNYIIAAKPTEPASVRNRALSSALDDPFDPSMITSEVVSPDASQVITNNNADIEWLLMGAKGEYVLYNTANKVYLDLSEPGKGLLTLSENDQFDIVYYNLIEDDWEGYTIQSVQNLSTGDEALKYLGLDHANPSYFTTDSANGAPQLYLYRQQATYYSYPDCTEGMEAIYWEKDGSGNCFVTLESYVLSGAPDMNYSQGEPTLQSDGTYRIQYNPTLLPPCSKAEVNWDGSSTTLRIPFIVNSDVASSTLLADQVVCDTCDVYVMTGNTFTVDDDRTLQMVTVQDGATLSVTNATTLAVKSLVLFAEGDQTAPAVDLNDDGSIDLKFGELYHHRRIDEARFYWFALPYSANLKEISYSNVASNGGAPTYREDFWIKYYNGAKRAADANLGVLAKTYWAHVADKGAAYTLQAGQGYQIGLNDQADVIQPDGKKHTKRIIRFTMRPDASWNEQEHATKVVPVVPSMVNDPKNAVHAGWNLIGNPYMHNYSVTESDVMRCGAWKKEMNGVEWTGWYILDEGVPTDVPYLTVYDPSTRLYSQERAANFRDLRPFEALFVQVNEGTSIVMDVPSAVKPVQRRYAVDEDLNTGIQLVGYNSTDRTGVVLGDDYTTQYEICGDLLKSTNAGRTNIYTIDANGEALAFIAMSDDDALTPIPLGVMCPSAGTYTFRFDNERYNSDNLDTLQLIDNEAGVSIDLLQEEYAVYLNQGTDNSRFRLLVRRAQQTYDDTTTGLTPPSDESRGAVRKFIRNGHLFIVRDGKTYNSLGSWVR